MVGSGVFFSGVMAFGSIIRSAELDQVKPDIKIEEESTGVYILKANKRLRSLYFEQKKME